MKSSPRLIFGILQLLIATSAVCYLLMSGFRILLVPALIFLAYSVYGLIKGYNVQIRKIQILFDAVENNDFSFRFPEKGLVGYELELNKSFNGMRELMAKAKSDIIERERYYELILGKVTTGIVVIDQDGYVHQTNEHAMQLLNLNVLTHTQQLSCIDENFPNLFRTLPSEQSRQISFTTERGDKNLSINATELKGKNKTLRIIAINDIDSELDDNEIESWVRLTRVLTHEIMNGISPITSLSEVLLKKIDDPNHLRDGLGVINHTSNQLMSFVSSYRKFTRIPEPDKEIIDLKDLFSMEIIGMKSTTNLPISFELKIEPVDLMLYADKNMISQIILNILRNAIHALEFTPSPYIRITAHNDEKDRIIIDIDNNGQPIPTEIAKQIFVPFFTTKESGSGIGLSVSKQIMRKHQGMIKLSYSSPKETRFTMIFN